MTCDRALLAVTIVGQRNDLRRAQYLKLKSEHESLGRHAVDRAERGPPEFERRAMHSKTGRPVPPERTWGHSCQPTSCAY